MSSILTAPTRNINMNENTNPIEFLIEFAWANGADLFVVNNAKDELKRLKEDNNRWLSCESELYQLKKVFEQPVAWGLKNDRGDLYNIRTQDNPYTPDEICVPLYTNKVEYKDFYEKFRTKNG